MKTALSNPFKRNLRIALESYDEIKTPRIALLIKNEILRAGASCYLRKQGYDICEVNCSIEEIAQEASESNFSVIISDQPRKSLIRCGQLLSSSDSFKSIVAIDVSPDEHLLNANVRVFLSNPFSPEILLLGVQSALESSYFFPINKCSGQTFATSNAPENYNCQIRGLSERELQVLSKLASGLSNKELGAELFVTEDTVKSHLHNLLRKLNVRNRTELVAKFLQADL